MQGQFLKLKRVHNGGSRREKIYSKKKKGRGMRRNKNHKDARQML